MFLKSRMKKGWEHPILIKTTVRRLQKMCSTPVELMPDAGITHWSFFAEVKQPLLWNLRIQETQNAAFQRRPQKGTTFGNRSWVEGRRGMLLLYLFKWSLKWLSNYSINWTKSMLLLKGAVITAGEVTTFSPKTACSVLLPLVPAPQAHVTSWISLS